MDLKLVLLGLLSVTVLADQQTLESSDVEKESAGEEAHFEELVRTEFDKADKDKSGSLELSEINALIEDAGVPESFDWRKFDDDKNDALSFAELHKLAKAYKAELDEDDEENDEEEEAPESLIEGEEEEESGDEEHEGTEDAEFAELATRDGLRHDREGKGYPPSKDKAHHGCQHERRCRKGPSLWRWYHEFGC